MMKDYINNSGCVEGETEHDHKKILDKVKNEMPTDELLCDLSDLFKVFGDTTRIKILYSIQSHYFSILLK